MAKSVLNVGLIGYQFMGKAHSNAYRQVNHFFDLPSQVRLHTLCGRTAAPLEAARASLGWENAETDWRKVIENPEIDIVDVSTPGDSHAEIAIAAARAGKIVFCEKPLANTIEQAQAMLEAAEESGVAHALFHNYRKAPAVALAKQMIQKGRLGTIYHMRAVYLQDWIADPKFPLVWRLQKEKAGSGTHGDIHSHIIDLGRHLVGEFESVCGMMHTFIKKRPLAGAVSDRLGAESQSEMGDVTVDDTAAMLARFKNGALGVFEASRFAVGRKNHNRFEINGSRGSVVFNLERMNELEFYSVEDREGEQGFRVIQATEAIHPYSGHYWPVGHIIGYEHTFVNLLADAITAICRNELPSPNFFDGVENQRVLDAVGRSAGTKQWVDL